jgi:hypothetical protein
VDLDLERLFATLHRYRVVYVLIGGLAAVFHGSPFLTEDADITPDTDGANLTRLAAALRDLNARIRTESVPEGLPFACDAQALAGAQTWNLVTEAGVHLIRIGEGVMARIEEPAPLVARLKIVGNQQSEVTPA